MIAYCFPTSASSAGHESEEKISPHGTLECPFCTVLRALPATLLLRRIG
jgi:hypothetical protein